MAEEEKDKRYYWLRLKRDFFKRHDIQIIESQPNGKDYVLFYLKLLVESVDHLGNLRFSDTIPYNEHMLATITNTNIDIVRSAMKVFTELQMIDVLSDQTIYMNEIESLIGSESYWAEKKRLYRDNQPQLGQCPQNVLDLSGVSPTCPSKSKSKNQSKSNSNNKKSSHFVPPTIDEIKAYCAERKNNVDPQKFYDYFNTPDDQGRTWIDSKGDKVKNWKQKIITWEQHNKSSNKPLTAPVSKFNNHPQRTYTDQDYAALEKSLMNKGL